MSDIVIEICGPDFNKFLHNVKGKKLGQISRQYNDVWNSFLHTKDDLDKVYQIFICSKDLDLYINIYSSSIFYGCNINNATLSEFSNFTLWLKEKETKDIDFDKMLASFIEDKIQKCNTLFEVMNFYDEYEIATNNIYHYANWFNKQ
jgi:hypothetical protein